MKIERKGNLFVIEGGPGSGKSTQARLLSKLTGWTLFREPGGTEFGELIREVLQERHDLEIHKLASLFGYMTTRANLVALEAIPRIENGENIIFDRYWYSTYAYQGAEGVSKKDIAVMAKIATQGLKPRLSIYYDIDPKLGQERKNMARQRQDRYDVKDLDFLKQVRVNYFELINRNPNRWVVIDASGTIEEVHDLTIDTLKTRGLIK